MDYTRDSNFNMGIAHLHRIDAILNAIAESKINQEYAEWHRLLTILVDEVSFLFNQQEKDEDIRLENECAYEINNTKNLQSIYNKLKQYDAFVRKQLSERKMLMAFSRDVKTAIADLG